MPNCLERIEIFCIEGQYLAPYIGFLNNLLKYLGNCLVVVVYLIKIFLVFTSFAIILPYEQWYQPMWLLSAYCCFGVYLLVNIVYHYHKARTLPPVPKPGKEGDRFCVRCNYFKSDRTHHCGVCKTCVLGMDHHCIWINQCVGSHNHRHFFLFIVFLTMAGALIVVAGFNSIYDHLIEYGRDGKGYCISSLTMAPMQAWICEHGELARNSVIFCYFLSVILTLLVGALTTWNIYLISKGFTYIDYLRHSDIVAQQPGYRNPLDRGVRANWVNFLGLRRNRSFWRHVALPSSHPPIHYDSYGRVEKFEVV